MSQVSDTGARATRTGIQTGAAFVVTEFIDAFFYDFDERQYGALVAVLTLLISLAQNLVENKAGKALLKEMPPKNVDVVEEG